MEKLKDGGGGWWLRIILGVQFVSLAATDLPHVGLVRVQAAHPLEHHRQACGGPPIGDGHGQRDSEQRITWLEISFGGDLACGDHGVRQIRFMPGPAPLKTFIVVSMRGISCIFY
jgi:hypothetical protein